MKQVTIIALKRGEELQVPYDEGQRVKTAFAKGKGVIVLRSYGNRMIDVVMIGDVRDEWIIDPQQQLVKNENAPLLEAKPKAPVTEDSPGYKKFLAAKKKLQERIGSRTRKY